MTPETEHAKQANPVEMAPPQAALIEVETALVHSMLDVQRLKLERMFLCGMVYGVLLAFLILCSARTEG